MTFHIKLCKIGGDIKLTLVDNTEIIMPCASMGVILKIENKIYGCML